MVRGRARPEPFKRMHELRLGLGLPAELDVGPAGLEIPEIGAGGDLQPLLAARRPRPPCRTSWRRKSSGRRCTSARRGRAAPEPEISSASAISLSSSSFDVLRQDELDQLHLVELVAPLDAPDVLAGRHLLPPEAGGVGHVV